MKDNNLRTIAQKYGITLIYLFGSEEDKGKKYLEGEEVIPDAFSDLDVAIAFETPPVDAIRTYGFLYREISERFDPFNVDLIFMHEVNTLFQYEIIKGVRIYEKDELYADNFEETIMKKSEELFYKKRVLHNEIMEAIEDGYFEFEYSPAP
ncbi:MAG: nucleotidyltransferase domain-containing protein [Nitrospira sp.]|nr:nucleotidyltransferase domain-containing protein [Nitrospira sp.]